MQNILQFLYTYDIIDSNENTNVRITEKTLEILVNSNIVSFIKLVQLFNLKVPFGVILKVQSFRNRYLLTKIYYPELTHYATPVSFAPPDRLLKPLPQTTQCTALNVKSIVSKKKLKKIIIESDSSSDDSSSESD